MFIAPDIEYVPDAHIMNTLEYMHSVKEMLQHSVLNKQIVVIIYFNVTMTGKSSLYLGPQKFPDG